MEDKETENTKNSGNYSLPRSPSQILHTLNDWRSDGRFCDVLLKVKIDLFPAHSCLLAVQSRKLSELMKLSEMKPAISAPLEIDLTPLICPYLDNDEDNDLLHSAMSCILKFIYTWELLPEKQCEPYLKIFAKVLELDGVVDAYQNFATINYDCSNNDDRVKTELSNLEIAMDCDFDEETEIDDDDDDDDYDDSDDDNDSDDFFSNAANVKIVKPVSCDEQVNQQKEGLSLDTSSSKMDSKSGKIHKCKVCQYSSDKIGDVKRHQSIHERGKISCKQCPFKTRKDKTMVRHQKQTHSLAKGIMDVVKNISDRQKEEIHQGRNAGEYISLQSDFSSTDIIMGPKCDCQQCKYATSSDHCLAVKHPCSHEFADGGDVAVNPGVITKSSDPFRILQKPGEEIMYECKFCPYQSRFLFSIEGHQCTHVTDRNVSMTHDKSYDDGSNTNDTNTDDRVKSESATDKEAINWNIHDETGGENDNTVSYNFSNASTVEIVKPELCDDQVNEQNENLSLDSSSISSTPHKDYPEFCNTSKNLISGKILYHKCKFCRFTSKNIGDVKRHQSVHSSGRISCKECPFNTRNDKKMARHQKQMHGHVLTMALANRVTCKNGAGKVKLYCTDCDFKTAEAKKYVAHLHCHDKDPNKCYQKNCDYIANNSRELTIHLQNHQGKLRHECKVCGKDFVKKSGLDSHAKVHSDERNFFCEICHATFKFSGAFQNHQKTHSQIKEHLCPLCGYNSKYKASFDLHMREHTGEYFYCTFEGCTHKTVNKHWLERHMAIHRNEKPFQCHYCGMGFNRAQTLKMHIRTHTNERPYTCSLCSYAASRRDKFNRHMKNVHGQVDTMVKTKV